MSSHPTLPPIPLPRIQKRPDPRKQPRRCGAARCRPGPRVGSGLPQNPPWRVAGFSMRGSKGRTAWTEVASGQDCRHREFSCRNPRGGPPNVRRCTVWHIRDFGQAHPPPLVPAMIVQIRTRINRSVDPSGSNFPAGRKIRRRLCGNERQNRFCQVPYSVPRNDSGSGQEQRNMDGRQPEAAKQPDSGHATGRGGSAACWRPYNPVASGATPDARGRFGGVLVATSKNRMLSDRIPSAAKPGNGAAGINKGKKMPELGAITSLHIGSLL